MSEYRFVWQSGVIRHGGSGHAPHGRRRFFLIHLQVFKKLVELIGVLVCSLAWDCAFDDGYAVTDQVVAEITILVVLASGEQLVCWV